MKIGLHPSETVKKQPVVLTVLGCGLVLVMLILTLALVFGGCKGTGSRMMFIIAVTAIAIVARRMSPSDLKIADTTPEYTNMNRNPNMM